MFTVQNDWIEYEAAEPAAVQLRPVPARRAAVRGGAACAHRVPVVRAPRVAGMPQAAAARSGRAPAPRLRLTRRGQVVLVVLPALLALSGALLAAAPGVAEAAPRQAPRTVVVGSGETLWRIAERVAPQADPRVTVAAIERVNHLGGAGVDAGAVLLLPAGD
ncbi:LysM peptidoglycan-binding domain-containing protein [Amnibacterium sp.]|uniref:LysM peptidoglycan-binding domain-containing protein n=1 Tax=Amnibacterium sp. TaxID=1872496 RepID=UPI003F7C8D21